MNYPEGTFGQECPVCGKFVPVNGPDGFGHMVPIPVNPLHFCPDCWGRLLNIVRKEGLK